MPAGALIQLVAASGEQDLYIIGNPQITFFNTVYRRHTNFAIDTVSEIFSTPAGYGKTAKCIIPRQGDLVSNLTLHVKLGSLNSAYDAAITASENATHINCDEVIDENGNVITTACPCRSCIENSAQSLIKYGWVNSLGHALIKSTWIEIGGKKIDKHYGEWMEIWSELTQTQEKQNSFYEMIGKVDSSSYSYDTFPTSMDLYIPLNFWFCKNQGLALPLLSLYYNEVAFYVDFRKFDDLWVKKVSTDPSATKPFFDASVLVEYIYLDLEERKTFYEESQVYLIEQIQTTDTYDSSNIMNSIDLFFNHPVKELIWILQRDDVTGPPSGIYHDTTYPIGNDWFNFSIYPCRTISSVKDPFESAVIQINGSNRMNTMPSSYFRLVEPYYRHTNNPINYIYTYSFALKPEEHQPTGHLNFSRINYARLVIKMRENMTNLEKSKYDARVYGLNYNVLIVSRGMAGLLFSN